MCSTSSSIPLGLLLTCLLIGHVQKVASSDGVLSSFKIHSKIEHRYAVTHVTSSMKNVNDEATELKFKMKLPKTAFISSLIMEIDGRNYTSKVKEKQAARKTYDSARKRGKTTGIVEQRSHDDQNFEVSTNVAAQGKVTFYLTYEELLRRVKGRYLYSVQVRPGHVVPRVEVEVEVIEREPITNLTILQVPGDNLAEVREDLRGPGRLSLIYRPEVTSQMLSRGVDGTFSFSYDVERRPDGGEVEAIGDYFVHYFSPEGLPKMAVHTVFVLDTSGSMSGNKIVQLKGAMETILRDLRTEDTFELVSFESRIHSLGYYNGTKKDIKKAVKKIRSLSANGGTNLNGAYLHAIEKANQFEGRRAAKQIVFLTDGEATSGDTVDNTQIRRRAREANTQRHPIYGLAFGRDADFKLLKEVSADNRAFARQIDESKDVELQLTGFYAEIATPLMAEVEVLYLEEEVDLSSLVKQGTAHFYSGGEVVTAGVMVPGASHLRPTVSGVAKSGPLQFQVNRVHFSTAPAVERENFVARLWAYLTVQELLAQAAVSEDVAVADALKAKALEVALRFGFVTKVTSLVVIRPQDELAEEEEDEEEKIEKAETAANQNAQRSVGYSGPANLASIKRKNPSSASRSSFSQKRRKASSPSSSSFVDNDPHFVVRVLGLDLPVCFDFHAYHNACITLVRDPISGVIVNGKVSEAKHNTDLTYFTSLFLNLGNFNMTVTTDGIHVDCLHDDGLRTVSNAAFLSAQRKGRRHRTRNGRHLCDLQLAWNFRTGIRYDNATLTRRGKKLQVVLGDEDLHLVVTRSTNKRGQKFLGFYILENKILSSSTGGIIGQFTHKEVTAVSGITLDISDKGKLQNTVQFSVPRNYSISETSGILAKRRSTLDKVRVQCLHIPNNGRAILDGTPDDYLLPCLTC